VRIVGDDAELASMIHFRTIYDLYRGEPAPDAGRLLAVVDDFRARSAAPPVPRERPCGGINKVPGVLFSDGNLLALAALRGCQLSPGLLRTDAGRRLRDAILVAVEDDEGRLMCSGFVHRVLDASGTRPAAPANGLAFIDLSDFPTDEPELVHLGRALLREWLLDKLTAGLDVDHQSMQTCLDIVHVILCHWERRTPVPAPLHRANFLTPGDLALSPSLRRVASRYRLPTAADSGWTDPLPMPLFGSSPDSSR
jgi:hypothetical protein